MIKVTFQDKEFEFATLHEDVCRPLHPIWVRWEKPAHSVGGWLPDFVLKNDGNIVYVNVREV